MGGGTRQEKVAEAIRAAAADYLIKNLANSTPGFITVSKVKMAPDLKLASIYCSIFGDKEAVEKSFRTLQDHLGRIRYHVGNEVRLKYVPELRLFLDDTLEQVVRVNSILSELE